MSCHTKTLLSPWNQSYLRLEDQLLLQPTNKDSLPHCKAGTITLGSHHFFFFFETVVGVGVCMWGGVSCSPGWIPTPSETEVDLGLLILLPDITIVCSHTWFPYNTFCSKRSHRDIASGLTPEC